MRRRWSPSRSWRFFSRASAPRSRQAGLWAIVYLLTGITLDWLGGRPPRFETAWEHWRTGFVKGAIYGALFMGFILVAALVLRAPGAATILDRAALLIGPVGGALAFPLAQTIIGSADGTRAVLRPAEARLPRSARAGARGRRRPRPRARLSRRPRRLRWRRALPGDGGGRGALLRRRRSGFRRLERHQGRAAEAAKLAPLRAGPPARRPRRRRARMVFRRRRSFRS